MAETARLPESALELLLKTHETERPDHLHRLALQIQHNLQYQHRWTNIEIHTRAPKSSKKFSRPLISGLPPKRLYMHPDEQAELLKQHSNSKDTASSFDDVDEVSPLEKPVMEWVLPTHLKEKWSLRQFSEVFDALDDPVVGEDKPWDKHKRVVLATLQDDSTIVYYVCRLPIAF
jgi:tRNA-splicing endonuclease subunit Sen15